MLSLVNNNQPTFKQYSLVQVSKKAFHNPENYLESARIFGQILEKNLSPVKKRFEIWPFKIKPKRTFDFFLEQPGYAFLRDKLKQFGDYSLEWLSLHTGIDIKKPMKDKYHSFIVYSGSEYDDIKNILNYEHYQLYSYKILNEYFKRKSNPNLVTDDLWLAAKSNEVLSKSFNKCASKYTPKKYIVETLSELETIGSELTK